MLKVQFFARLKDQLGTANIEVEIPASISVVDLKAQLIANNNTWQKPLSADNILCAVNHEVVSEQHIIKSSDEVAFFPPVTGG
ncbi:molybdopterin converting factor subunit 1 [Thalassotalea atypica]|uniref:molybdopterin converting factor subunit 1 n=1 Tax=Thalassotalea atypica TaxID=2054316 RepID=UPI002573D1F0|nr:molybdopterin converting factor subunit 1 [Thalassotalea atypica]